MCFENKFQQISNLNMKELLKNKIRNMSVIRFFEKILYRNKFYKMQIKVDAINT